MTRLRKDQQIDADAPTRVTEYFHPRAQEIVATLPMRLGLRIEASPGFMRILTRLFDKGRRVRTDRIRGYTLLWLVAGLRPMRRKLLRHAQESKHLDRLIVQTREIAQHDYALACEMLRCQRLIKGYSDTHARGHSKYSKVMRAVDMLVGRKDAADWVRRMRGASLSKEGMTALDGTIQTIASFATDGKTT
jgi:indolepyruvate ferredoxin oxidoreductase beta subunit